MECRPSVLIAATYRAALDGVDRVYLVTPVMRTAGFVPADYAVMLRWLTGTIIEGNGARPNGDVERVTGRPATDFRDFVRRNVAAWTAKAAE